MRALVIDASRSYRRLIGNVLAECGVEALEAASIAEAREHLAGAPPDLICMAMTLPDGDSAKFCLQIRAQPAQAGVPILMLTANENAQAAHRCLAAGVTTLFRRQDYAAFGACVRRMLDRRSRRGRASGLVLYLEDTRSVAMKTRHELIARGYQVDHFGRAEDGIRAFDEKDYDLVLTDIVLEGTMSGTTLLESIRQHEDPARRTVPVIAVSSYNDAARRVQLFRAGVSDYVTKPVLEEELIARVRNLIDNRRLLTQLAESHERLTRIAMSDQLTGLSNRHFVNDTAPGLLAGAVAANRPLALALVDVDHFKSVNDRFGHDRGDEVLQALGALLAGAVEGEEIAARLGGEEFMLLLPGCPQARAVERCEELRLRLLALQPGGIEVSASFGVAMLALGDDFGALYKRADTATYAAKQAGRNRVVCA